MNGKTAKISWHFATLALLGGLGCAGDGLEPGQGPADVQLRQGALACAQALLAPAGATASSQENATLSAAKAIDGDPNTRWSSAFSDPQWLYVDYGAKVLFKEVKVTWEAAYSKSYDVQVATSAAGPWTTVYSRNPFGGGVDDKTGLTAQGRYLRVYSNARGTQFGNSIKELQAWGNTDLACVPVCAPGATQCAGAQVRTCDANGQWAAPAACASGGVCAGSACAAEVSVAPAPVAYYPLEGNTYAPTGPNALDVGGGGYHAHPRNVTLSAGKVGNGYTFNGQAATSSTASQLPLGFYGNRGGTIFASYLGMCMWVKPAALASGKAQPLYSTVNTAPYNTLAIATASPPAGSCGGANEVFMGSSAAGDTCERSGLTVTPGAWNHVCYFHNYGANLARFWVNGVASTQLSNAVWQNNLWANDTIGYAPVSNATIYAGAFNGAIDEVALFNQPLTTTMVQALYNAGKGGQPRPAANIGAGATGAQVTQLSQGDTHTCAVLSDGTVWCWGANDRDQLGTTGGAALLAQQVPGVTGAKKVVALASGATCALLTSGAVKCWGDNTNGQTGNGAGTPATVATPTAVPGVSTAADIAGGNMHVCVVLADKTVECWGSNGMGQIGYGSLAGGPTAPQPVLAVDGAPGTKLGNVTGLLNGTWNNHMCAVLGNGTAACWGDNQTYQLGIQADGRAPQTCSTAEPCVTYPKKVLGLDGKTVTGIAGGHAHTCFLVSAGNVWCVGGNNDLQLGLAAMYQDKRVPDMQAAAVEGATSITAGSEHTCVTFSDGTAGCWGNNSFGQFGNSNCAQVAVQWWILVMGDTFSSTNMTGVTSIDAGGDSTCAITHGVPFCFGRNLSGQNGAGTSSTADVLVPFPVQ